MERGSQKANLSLIVLFAGASLSFGQEPVTYQVRHDHWRKGCDGVLTVTAGSVSFMGKKHAWTWKFDDIEQLKLSDHDIGITTYRDRLLRLGLDQQEQFTMKPGQDVRSAYRLLKDRMDQRLVVAAAFGNPEASSAIPAKLLGVIGGAQGVLELGEDWIAFRTPGPGESRTWRFTDIDNIARTGPFRLTLVTFERGRAQYGDRKEFNFQLRQPLPETQYDALWLRLNESKGLKILTTYKESMQ